MLRQMIHFFVKFSVSVFPTVNENDQFFYLYIKLLDEVVSSIKELHVSLTKAEDNLDSEMVILWEYEILSWPNLLTHVNKLQKTLVFWRFQGV